jgi:hypothetical protein
MAIFLYKRKGQSLQRNILIKENRISQSIKMHVLDGHFLDDVSKREVLVIPFLWLIMLKHFLTAYWMMVNSWLRKLERRMDSSSCKRGMLFQCLLSSEILKKKLLRKYENSDAFENKLSEIAEEEKSRQSRKFEEKRTRHRYQKPRPLVPNIGIREGS